MIMDLWIIWERNRGHATWAAVYVFNLRIRVQGSVVIEVVEVVAMERYKEARRLRKLELRLYVVYRITLTRWDDAPVRRGNREAGGHGG